MQSLRPDVLSLLLSVTVELTVPSAFHPPQIVAAAAECVATLAVRAMPAGRNVRTHRRAPCALTYRCRADRMQTGRPPLPEAGLPPPTSAPGLVWFGHAGTLTARGTPKGTLGYSIVL